MLVLTDFFPAAGRALDYAAGLAAPLGAQLVLLHVRRDSLLDPDALTGKLANLSPPAVKLALTRLTEDLPVPAVAEVSHGRVLPAVLDAVSRLQPALVVLGRPDREELPDELTSTTALDLLQNAPSPLLVVPPSRSGSSVPRRLLLAVDGEPFTLGEFAGPARQLLSGLQAELTVLHCAPEARDSAAALDAATQTGLTAEMTKIHVLQVVTDNPADGILTTAQSSDYDAVVMLARRRSVLGRLFHRSVTAQVLLHCSLPVLVLPVE
nr:universal stress protein [Hymenobacter translucens]